MQTPNVLYQMVGVSESGVYRIPPNGHLREQMMILHWNYWDPIGGTHPNIQNTVDGCEILHQLVDGPVIIP